MTVESADRPKIGVLLMRSASKGSQNADFGKDFGLIHEAAVTCRKAGWGKQEWSRLAHDQNLAELVGQVLRGEVLTVLKPFGVVTQCSVERPTSFSTDQLLRSTSCAWVKHYGREWIAETANYTNIPDRRIDFFYADVLRTVHSEELWDMGFFVRVPFNNQVKLERSMFLACLNALLEMEVVGSESSLLSVSRVNKFFYFMDPHLVTVTVTWSRSRNKWVFAVDVGTVSELMNRKIELLERTRVFGPTDFTE